MSTRKPLWTSCHPQYHRGPLLFGPGQRVVQEATAACRTLAPPSTLQDETLRDPVEGIAKHPSTEPPNALNVLPRLCRQQRTAPGQTVAAAWPPWARLAQAAAWPHELL